MKILGKEEIEKRVKEFGYSNLEKLKDDISGNDKIHIIDKFGYKYFSSYYVIKNSNKRNAELEKFSLSNPYSFYNISLWCEIENKPFVLVGGKFSNTKPDLIFKCHSCREEFNTSWNNISSGRKCPYCRGLRVSYGNSLYKNYPEICLDWDYEKNLKNPTEYTYGSKNKVCWKCHICEFKWETSICNRTSSNRGCPNCANKKSKGRPSSRKKSQENFIKEVYNLVNEEYSILGEYEGTDKNVLMRHNLCKNEWAVKPQSFLRGTRCPVCNFSKGEVKIEKLLKHLKIRFIFQHRFDGCRDKNPLPFDFYLPKYNLCLEYHGEQHYKPKDFAGKGKSWANNNLKGIKRRDKIKKKYCEDNNIQLLIIPYWEFDNIEQILEQTLSKLG